jgi:NADPH:quinone reductase-like Zn-dependent oxidoreductase
MSDKPIVDITDVMAGTTSVKARDLKKGYLVFDAFGRVDPLERDARLLKGGDEVSFKREGYWTEYTGADDDFTVIIPEG